MKQLLLALIVALSFTACDAAEKAHGPWITDYAKALTTAKAEKKLVLLDFTGSDWCPPCKALHKNVFATKDFVEFAKENLVLVEVDFPNYKKQSDELKRLNKELARKFKIEGYPTIIIVNAEGKELSKEVGYQGDTPKSYMAKIEKLLKP